MSVWCNAFKDINNIQFGMCEEFQWWLSICNERSEEWLLSWWTLTGKSILSNWIEYNRFFSNDFAWHTHCVNFFQVNQFEVIVHLDDEIIFLSRSFQKEAFFCIWHFLSNYEQMIEVTKRCFNDHQREREFSVLYYLKKKKNPVFFVMFVITLEDFVWHDSVTSISVEWDECYNYNHWDNIGLVHLTFDVD